MLIPNAKPVAAIGLIAAGIVGCTSAGSSQRPPETPLGQAAAIRQAPAQKPIIAVFDIEARDIGYSPTTTDRISDYLTVLLVETGRYRVVPRDSIKRRLRQQKRASYNSCVDRSCQIEIGRELAANKALVTRALRIGQSCRVTATVYDLKSATAESAAQTESAPQTTADACDAQALSDQLPALVAKLTGQPLPQTEQSSANGPKTIKLRCPNCIVDEEANPSYRSYKSRLKRIEDQARPRYRRR
ncbi:MAG: hypothetical protein H6707_02370 [Deltaproteobacteria bacterium]|nr:hypothetical protein [Deltaproteobacteria bacterium]